MHAKFIFLYLYGLHQLYHSAMIAMELGVITEKNDVLCLSCNPEHTKILKQIKSFYPATKTEIVELAQPFRYKYLNLKKKLYPSVNAMVKRATKYLKEADFIITTSHSTPKMLKKFNITKPKIIYQYHGCGDRKYGFDPGFKQFDFMLLPGKYHQARLMEEKIISENHTKVIGWPKFDYSGMAGETKLFNNDNPTFLYTPHWKVELTSYNKFAEKILKYFSDNPQYNLIFAPHLLIKHWKTAYNYNINFGHFNSDNIRIDYGSDFSTNGAYLKFSDIYIGDVSSMVFEFIAMKLRPCIFLNAHNITWKNNADYRFWEYGQVVDDLEQFDNVVNKSIGDASFANLQKTRVQEYLDIQEKKSSLRGAEAILNFSKEKLEK